MMIIVGYIGGFILGMLFNTDGIDQGGGRINNGWIILGIAFIVSILAGIILEFIVNTVIITSKTTISCESICILCLSLVY